MSDVLTRRALEASHERENRLFTARMRELNRKLAHELDINFSSNPFRSLDRRFVVAAAPRTGSHLFCEGLLAHGAAVQEVFDLRRMKQVCRKSGLYAVEDYCLRILAKFAANGVFGVKGGVKVLAPLVLAGEFPEFRADWKFIYLKRRDVIKQAISQLKAELTGAYKASKQPARELTDADFDAQRIVALVDRLLKIYSTWEETFELFDIKPLRLFYEDLAADPPGVAAKAAEYLDLRGPPIEDKQFLSEPMKIQSTPLNSQWETRFRAEHREFCEAREDTGARSNAIH